MGWKTDWLYQMIFDNTRDVWQQACSYVKRHNEDALYPEEYLTPMESLLVYQFTDADLASAWCRGEVLRKWRYAGTTFEPYRGEPPGSSVVKRDREFIKFRHIYIHRPISNQGTVCFYISRDRKRVVFTYILGPLCGRGVVYGVMGQGRTGRFYNAPEGGRWLS